MEHFPTGSRVVVVRVGGEGDEVGKGVVEERWGERGVNEGLEGASLRVGGGGRGV